MKILFSDNTLWGLLNFRGGVIRYFAEHGYKIVLVAPQDKLCDLSSLPGDVKYHPIELNRTGTNPLADLSYYQNLRKIYKKERPNYIFHYTIKPNIYGTLAARSLNIRSSCIIAGLGHVYSAKGIGNMIARFMYKYALRFPERIMVLNQENYNLLIDRGVVDPDRLLWLRGGEGVDTEQFTAQPMPNHERPVFLMICRLLYEKGYSEYVAAAEALQGQAEFRIMGPIDTHPSAVPEAVVRNDVARGVIKYIEYSPDVVSQVSASDCIVLPSSYGEGLSRVLMEALAMGRPIITTDIAGCRETVTKGDNGFLCYPKDIDSLTEACSRFLSLSTEKRTQMGIRSRELAEKTFDIRSIIKQYAHLIH